MTVTRNDDTPSGQTARLCGFGLSGKLLGFTVAFVMLAEVLIYVPSIATYRERWLEDRLVRAHSVALVMEATPPDMLPAALVRQLLNSVGARTIALKTGEMRKLLAASDTPETEAMLIDLRENRWPAAIWGAFGTLAGKGDGVLRIVGSAPMGGDFVEVTINERPLRAAMLAFSVNILIVSLLISGITAALLYLALDRMIVRPVRRLTADVVAFREAPEDASRILVPSGRSDEVGVAEREVAAMQRELSGQLQSKARLAALGLAVSKINHDLRNLLATAQLISERLETSSDPLTQRLAPKLLSTLERAVDYCRAVLDYGRAQEREPERRPVDLAALIAEIQEAHSLTRDPGIAWATSVERGLMVDADPDQLFRILNNLVRNAIEALESRGPTDPARDQIRISGRRENAAVVIEVSDTGPGLPEKARQHLFEAFSGSTRRGGTGLGLVIAAELVRAHGGEIRHVEGTLGATFRITIPDRPLDLAAHRAAKTRGRMQTHT